MSILKAMVTPDLVKELRLRAGLSQGELAKRLDIHPTAISRWERGQVLPSFETLRKIAAACGLEIGIRIANRDETEHDIGLIRQSLKKTPSARLRENVEITNSLLNISPKKEKRVRV